MTEPKNPTPETQNLPEAPDFEETLPNQAEAAGFFYRVRRVLNPEEKPVHPTEAAEIVIMNEDEK